MIICEFRGITLLQTAMQEASRAHQEEMMKLASSSNQHVEPQAPPESTNNTALEEERQALQDMVDSLKDENSQLREQIKKLARDKENHVETISKEESIEVPDHNVDVYGKGNAQTPGESEYCGLKRHNVIIGFP